MLGEKANKLKNILAPLFGAILFFVILFSQMGLSSQQQNFLAVFSWVVFSWLFSNIPLPITGLLGAAIASFLKIAPASEIMAPFASNIIFLFLAGFLLAQAMQEIQLDRRISLGILAMPFIKGSFKRMILALMAISATFSMWVSNTATTAMMLPIVMGTLLSLKIEDKNITALILLGLAYSSSIGGIAGPVGSPPNIIAMEMLNTLNQNSMSFIDWIFMGFPLALLFIGMLSFYIIRQVPEEYKSFDNVFIKKERALLASFGHKEIILLCVFIITVFLWFLPGMSSLLLGKTHWIAVELSTRLNPGIVGIFMASILFIIPLDRKGSTILRPHNLSQIDWGTLLLFGAGLSMGKLLFKTGLAEIIGQNLQQFTQGYGPIALLLTLSLFTIFFTELASNTASANILIPIVIALAQELGMDAKIPVIIVGISCGLAFMLPVSTPPNAIVYGSGKIEKKQMIKMGLILNIVFGIISALYFTIVSQL